MRQPHPDGVSAFRNAPNASPTHTQPSASVTNTLARRGFVSRHKTKSAPNESAVCDWSPRPLTMWHTEDGSSSAGAFPGHTPSPSGFPVSLLPATEGRRRRVSMPRAEPHSRRGLAAQHQCPQQRLPLPLAARSAPTPAGSHRRGQPAPAAPRPAGRWRRCTGAARPGPAQRPRVRRRVRVITHGSRVPGRRLHPHRCPTASSTWC